MVEYMEAVGPDVKRPRLNYDGPTRMASQQHVPPPSPAHQNPSILPAPSSTYAGSHHQQQPLPPQSPFGHEIPHDPRAPVEPSVHSFVQHNSGHTTPRDGRFPPELSYSRRGSASAAPRSPDDHHFQAPRSMSVAVPNDAPQYTNQPYSAGPTDHLVGYQPPDPHMNGTMSHGLPIHPHGEGAPGMAPAQYTDYGPPMHPGPGYAPMSYGGAGPQAQIRGKKGNRAQQACDICRTRKAKCDEGRPRCGFCLENDLQCNYQNVAPAKVDRVNQQIIDQLATTQDDLKTFRDDFRVFQQEIKTLLSAGGIKIEQHHVSKSSQDDKETKPSLGQMESPGGNIASASTATMLASPGIRDANMVDTSPSSSLNTSNIANDGLDHTKLNDIAVEHNTAAQKLFRWPSIKRLLEKSKLKESERDENFVMNFELRKGPMRLYGRGQGQEPGESIRIGAGAASPAASSTSGLSDEAPSPASSTDSSWGYGINPFIGESRADSVTGGLNPNNTLKLDAKTIDLLLGSYLTHIHMMHPFLDEANLTRMMDTFKRRHGLVASSAGNASVDALRDPSASFSRSTKRKASDGQYFVGEAMAATSAVQSTSTSTILLDRSPTTAMVLLILALGKICEYREPLPGPVPINTPERITYPGRSSSPQPGILGQSPTDSSSVRQSPTSSSQSMVNASAPSPTIGLLRQNHRSPRSSVGDLPPQVRNLDVIPGLAYYAQATDILGNLTGSTSLIHVQCCILAGLYSGQLANSIESLGWIQNAARTLMVILRVNDPTYKERKVWPNSVRFAYHTTSQLENDILAEIDLPRVGLEKRDYFPYPDGYISETTQTSPVHTPYELIMQCYSSQLHIRGILNQTQYSLYAPDMDMRTAAHKPTISVLDEFLQEIRHERLPDDLKWADSDPPASNINQARLRGKWYGGLYIVHRPYLHKALELDAEGGLDQYMQREFERQAYQSGSMGPPPPAGPQDRNLEYVLESAKKCITAAQFSTLAFDGYSDHRRLTVTNILGTSHAQFGNMLVLSAVYCSKHLRQFISEKPTERMDFLFKRTINMLRNLKSISATLGHDQYILECLRDVVFRDDEITPPSASFSSN